MHVKGSRDSKDSYEIGQSSSHPYVAREEIEKEIYEMLEDIFSEIIEKKVTSLKPTLMQWYL